MEEIVKEISAMFVIADKNMSENLKGNKAAGVRARRATLELEKLFKEYRRKSIETDRK